MSNRPRKREILLCIGVVALLSTLLGLTPSPQQITASGSKIYGAASTTSYATLNIPQGTAPTTPADGDEWYDSTQQALSFRQSTNTTVYQGGAVCVNITPVTASGLGSTSPQLLQACTIPAGLMNVLGKTIRIFGTGTMSVPAAGTAGKPAVERDVRRIIEHRVLNQSGDI
jgi:hypothetical protein